MSRARSRATAAAAASASLLVDVEPQCGLGWGLRIQRRVEPSGWPAALLKVPEQHRAQAEEYLRGMAARMRVLRRLGKL